MTFVVLNPYGKSSNDELERHAVVAFYLNLVALAETSIKHNRLSKAAAAAGSDPRKYKQLQVPLFGYCYVSESKGRWMNDLNILREGMFWALYLAERV